MSKFALTILLSVLAPIAYAEQPHFKDHAALYAYVAKFEGYAHIFTELPQARAGFGESSIQPALPAAWGNTSIRADAIVIGRKNYTFKKASDWPPSPATGAFKLDLQLTKIFIDHSGKRLCLQSSLGGNGGWARWRNIVIIDLNNPGAPDIHKWSSMYASCNGIFQKDGQLVIGTLWHHHLSENDFASMKLDLRNAWEGVLQARYELTLSAPGNAFDFVVYKK